MTLKTISEKIQKLFGKFPYYLCSGTAGNEYLFCRELTHFIGGVIIGLIPALTSSVLFSILAGWLIFIIIVLKEISEDNKSQSRFKTIIDVLSWTIGFLTPTLIKFVL